MEKEELKKFLEEKKNTNKSNKVDWDLQKTKWIEHVNSLYLQIDEWLHDFISDGILKTKKEIIEIFEEDIGNYQIDNYIISFDNYNIKLEPLGTMIIGAWGRIEMTGLLNKTIPFLLLPPNVSSTNDMVKVEIIDGNKHGEINGDISIGPELTDFEEDKYPVLEWKIFNENTRTLEKLTQNNFYQCIRILSKDGN